MSCSLTNNNESPFKNVIPSCPHSATKSETKPNLKLFFGTSQLAALHKQSRPYKSSECIKYYFNVMIYTVKTQGSLLVQDFYAVNF